MAPRTAWQAITLPPGRFLTSSWPWRCLAYLAAGVLLGAVALAGLLVIGLVGAALLVVVVGVAVLGSVLLTGVVLARFERVRLRLVDATEVPDPHRPPPRRGARAWLTTRLREQATWRELGYAIASLGVLCWLDLAVVTLCLGVPVGTVWSSVDTPGVPWYWRTTGVLFGLALLPVAAYPVAAWAAARAEMTRAVLAPKDAELGRRLVETTRSRARLVDAFEAERRRIERDLHDGAQQRLVAVTVSLGLARLDVPQGTPGHEHVVAAHEQARGALAELRELVRGIHPQVLTDRGLPAAVTDVAARSPLPVDVSMDLPSRLPVPVESAAYFAVCEALVNVARHARASRACVRAMVDGGLVLEVEDDGVGGADPAGPGLAGLADRVAVVDGRLYLDSPPGRGTLVRVEIPC